LLKKHYVNIKVLCGRSGFMLDGALEGTYAALENGGEAPTLPFRLHCMKTGRVAQIAIKARLQILA
jgi:hypothetical protein